MSNPSAAIWSSSSLVCASTPSTIATTFSSLLKGMAVVGDLTSRGIIALLLGNAVDQIPTASRRRFEAQAVDIRLEAGEFGVELPGVEQVVVDRLGCLRDLLAGHDQRDTGRVRHDHHGQRAPHEMVDLDAL